MRNATILIIIAALLISAGCSKHAEVLQMGNLKLTSQEFQDNGSIPSKYTCDGDDTSPQLEIEGIPPEAKSLALIMDDPDATIGVWNHWVMWNIPLVSLIEEGKVPAGAIRGMNSFKKMDYGGPCLPSGTHRYIFKLYALDKTLNLPEGAKKEEVENAMEGHIVAQTKLTGLYKRKN